MEIHHFYPRTSNIGDHFVQRGIEAMVRRIVPGATFQLLNINSRGKDKTEYGLTQSAVERANREADLIIVGGSNLYEGSFRWPWGVHLEIDAFKNLQVPLFLVGIGTGSAFGSPVHRPSTRAKREIKLLNDYATFSGARDVLTFEWLQRLGISEAKLMGDPATFVFNRPLQRNNQGGHILITMPARRFWTSKHQFWNVQLRGRSMFNGMVALARTLLEKGKEVMVTCNDPVDLPLAQTLFEPWLPGRVFCPETPEEYFALLSKSRAVVAGRLHTAVVAFSLGIPFILVDLDQRTHGFVQTYQLEPWTIKPAWRTFAARLQEQTDTLLSDEASKSWKCFIGKRDQMYTSAMDQLACALASMKLNT
ncbi:MAG: polysaccharide pyruvyl transferase family protein [Pyrinomonadaceae bacterium]|nr:polysaccharide pyruvyl transferase family protein [Pyrinomonadaceae bacterium]